VLPWRSRRNGKREGRKGPGNEAGMCLGINGFTEYAPIADWVVGEHLYGAPVALPEQRKAGGP